MEEKKKEKLQSQIEYLVDATPQYVSNFAHSTDMGRLLDTIWMAYQNKETREYLKSQIKDAFAQESSFNHLDELKHEIDNSVNYIYSFLDYAQRKNLLRE